MDPPTNMPSREASKRPSPPVVDETTPKKKKKESSSEANRGKLDNLRKRMLELEIPRFETKSIKVDQLQSDPSDILKLSNTYVEDIVEKMENKTWQHNSEPFIVVEDTDDKYVVKNGKHRLKAIEEFNKTDDEPILEVECHIYKTLNLDQLLILKKFPERNLTILQMAKYVREIIKVHALSDEEDDGQNYTKLMKVYFREKYSDTCHRLVQLKKFDDIINIVIKDDPIETLSELNVSFWKTFLSAAKRDSKKALQILEKLKKQKIYKIKKLLISVEYDLLEYLKARGSHKFKTEDEAIKYFTDKRKLSKNEFIKILNESGFIKNRTRTFKKCNWKKIKKSFQKYYKPVEHICENEDILLQQNFIVAENPTESFLANISDHLSKAVVLLISEVGQKAPVIKNIPSTAEFNIIVNDPPDMKEAFDFLPETSVNASLFLPDATTSDPKKNIKILTTKCVDKGIKLAKSMTLESIKKLGSLAENPSNALICCSSDKVRNHFIDDLKGYPNFKLCHEKTSSKSTQCDVEDSSTLPI